MPVICIMNNKDQSMKAIDAECGIRVDLEVSIKSGTDKSYKLIVRTCEHEELFQIPVYTESYVAQNMTNLMIIMNCIYKYLYLHNTENPEIISIIIENQGSILLGIGSNKTYKFYVSKDDIGFKVMNGKEYAKFIEDKIPFPFGTDLNIEEFHKYATSINIKSEFTENRKITV